MKNALPYTRACLALSRGFTVAISGLNTTKPMNELSGVWAVCGSDGGVVGVVGLLGLWGLWVCGWLYVWVCGGRRMF